MKYIEVINAVTLFFSFVCWNTVGTANKITRTGVLILAIVNAILASQGFGLVR